MYKSMRENSIYVGTPREMSDFLDARQLLQRDTTQACLTSIVIEISNGCAATSTRPPLGLHCAATARGEPDPVCSSRPAFPGELCRVEPGLAAAAGAASAPGSWASRAGGLVRSCPLLRLRSSSMRLLDWLGSIKTTDWPLRLRARLCAVRLSLRASHFTRRAHATHA